MSIYKIIGILRCPYLSECGPDKKMTDYDTEERAVERECFTRRHFSCTDYLCKSMEDAQKTMMDADAKLQEIKTRKR